MGFIARAKGAQGGPLAYLRGPGGKPEDDDGNILTNFAGDVQELIGGLGSLVGSGLTDLYRLGAEAVTGGGYTGGEDRPQGQFSMDDILINLTGYDPGDPVRSAETQSAVVEDLKTRYGPLVRGDFAEFGEGVEEDPAFFLLDLLGAGSLAGKGAQAVGKSAIASRAGAGGKVGEIASGVRGLLGEASRRQRPGLIGAGLDDLTGAGAQLGPVETLASRILPRAQPTLLPAGGGVTAVEQTMPALNPVRRAMAAPIRRAMTEPLDALETRVGRLEAMKEAGEALSFADETWLKTVGTAVKETRAAGGTRAYKPIVTSRLLRNGVNKLVGTHSSEWLARRQADLKTIQDITRPVVEEGLQDVAHGAAQGLDAADDIARLLAPEPEGALASQQARATAGFEVGGDLSGILRQKRPDLADELGIPKMGPEKPRVQVRPKVYRDEQGFGITGRDSWGRSVSIFTKTSEEAEIVRANIKAGHDATAGIWGSPPAEAAGALEAASLRPGATEAVAVAQETRPRLGSVAFEALEQAEEGSLEARVRDLARPSYDHLQDLRVRAGEAPDPDLARQIDLTERWLDHQMEPLRLSKRTQAGEAVPTLEKWREDMRTFMAREQNALVEAGIMTPAELMERAYLPLRVRFGAKFDHKLGEFVGGPSVEALDDAMKATGRGAPIYFPHIDSRRLKFSDYLMSRGRIGARKATADPHLKRNTAELLDKDLYVKDPVEAYSRRAARAVRAEETARFVQKVADSYGRKIGPDDHLAAGEVVWAPDGLLRFFRTQVKLEDEIADLMQSGLAQEEALAGTLKEVVATNLDDVRQVMRQGVGVTKKGLDLYAIPQTVADQIEAFTKFRLGKNTRVFWDGPVNLWRSFVLLGSPRWIVNNFLGNIVFQKLQGGRFRDVIGQLDGDYRRMLREIEGFDQLEQGLYGQGSQYVERLGTAAREGIGAAVEGAKQTRAYKLVQSWGNASRTLNAHLEDAFRQSSFVTALERQQVSSGVKRVGRIFWGSKRRLEDIARRGASPAQITEALQEVNRFFGDYRNLGPIEKGIIRRFLLPFYGFYKHTVKLAASMPVEAPGRAIALRSLAQASAEFREDLGPLPPWLEARGFPLGPGEAGAEEFLLTGGANPLEFVAELTRDPFHQLVSAGPPQNRIAIEQATGRSSLTGQPFSAEDVVTPFGSDQQFQIDPETGQAVAIEKSTPGILEHILRQFPQYELAKDLLAGGATYNTASLPDIATGGGVVRDESGEPLYPDDSFERILRMFGISTTDYDVAGYQEDLAEDADQALKFFMKRQQSGGGQGGPLSYLRS